VNFSSVGLYIHAIMALKKMDAGFNDHNTTVIIHSTTYTHIFYNIGTSFFFETCLVLQCKKRTKAITKVSVI